MNKHITDS